MKALVAATVLFAAASGSAFAFTSYVLPAEFLPASSRMRADAAFTATFFTPQIALSSDFKIIEPDGSDGIFEQEEIADSATHLGTTLLHPGTYRITSGERLGDVTTLVGSNGQWRPLGQGETPPAGADTTTLQTVTVADAYVTRGAPTRGAVDTQTATLAIHPITHPNQILISDGFQIEVTFNGQPFANSAIVLYSSGQADTDTTRYFVTDASGRATITLDQAGTYAIAARNRAAAPAGSPAAVRSYTTTLTFQAFDALPAVQEVQDETQQPPPSTSYRDRRRNGAFGNRGVGRIGN